MTNKRKKQIRFEVAERISNLADSIGCGFETDIDADYAEEHTYLMAQAVKILGSAQRRADKIYLKEIK